MFPVSVPYKYCYFSCHVCWGTVFIYFSCRKTGKLIWKKYRSLVISNYLAVVPGIGLLTVSRRRVGETQLQPTRRKRERDLNLAWASLALPSFPLHPSPPQGVTATASHNQSSPFFAGLPFSGLCRFLSSFFHSLNVTSTETTYPQEGNALGGNRSLAHIQEKR